ncbi:MAG: hypothetical protein NVS3B20_11600 [Polyangiales bacterium]
MVVFSDFQCPYCGRAAPVLHTLHAEYGDRLRVVFRDLPLPFHKNARPAAVVAQSVFLLRGSDAFFQMHDKMFANQSLLSEAQLIVWASELGVTEEALQRVRAEAEARVDASLAETTRLSIEGTPNFLIDGEMVTGAQPLEKFRAVIDAHIAFASELKAKGVTDRELYAEMLHHYYRKQAALEVEAPEADDFTVWHVPVGKSPVRGKLDAPVTIVTFSDFQCPYCMNLEPTLELIRAEYGDKVRFVFKHNPLPFHNRATPAAMFALEALKQKGNDGFWKAHDKLFGLRGVLDDAALEGAATELGLDTKKVMLSISTTNRQGDVDADLDLGELVGVTGTPASFVNGRSLHGAQPYEKFKKVIDQELPKAEARIKAGTPRNKVYDEIILGGKGSETIIPVPANAPFRGDRNAKTVIQIFGDFECPFTRRAVVDTAGAPPSPIREVIAKYGDKVKIVWRNFPLGFHPHAEPAAEFALEVLKQKGNAAFWKVFDDLMGQAPLDDATLEAIAGRAGVDWAKAKAAMDTHKYKVAIDLDMKDGSNVGVIGTPTFVIGTKKIVGAQPFTAFKRAIDRMLAGSK